MKANNFFLSLDLSTTNVGLAIWFEDGTLAQIDHLQIPTDRKVDEDLRFLNKGDFFKDFMIKYKNNLKEKYNGIIKGVTIEAPFEYTPKNKLTTAMLLEMNGVACYILKEIFGDSPKRIRVTNVRKLFCPELINREYYKRSGELKSETFSPDKSLGFKVDIKHYIWEKVAWLQPEIDWYYKPRAKTIDPKSYDMSDAYAVGIASLLDDNIIQIDDWVNKNNKYKQLYIEKNGKVHV